MKSEFYVYKTENILLVNQNNILLNVVFSKILQNYITRIDKDTTIGKKLFYYTAKYDEDPYEFVFSIIFILYNHSLTSLNKTYKGITDDKDFLLSLIDGIYDFYRSSIRFMIARKEDFTPSRTIKIMNEFSDQIIKLYRKVYEKVLSGDQRVYRELASGLNGALLIEDININLPIELDFLKDIKPITSIIIRPPFIVQTSSNKRDGIFKEDNKPLDINSLDLSSFYLLPVKIRDELALSYIHKQYISAIPGLGTLFEIADDKYITQHKPSIIMIYGTNIDNKPYYYKTSDGTYVGVISLDDKYDYFGYVKKMLLTLFNLTMIDKNILPIHGAGLTISLRNGITKNVVILGDSGAGKSETIEAMKHLEDSSIADITTIYDDMGSFILEDNNIYTLGTETGAFVRLDDLDKAYSLLSIDRAVFYNPHMTNSRVIVPMSSFLTTITKAKVDLFLYAINYETSETGIKIIKDQKEAEDIFIAGKRYAMKTTSEKGMVETFFANPFGPLQKEEQVRPLIHDMFTHLYENNIPVGVLYTNLSNDNDQSIVKAAKGLLEIIKKPNE